jgi:hypothetical protein
MADNVRRASRNVHNWATGSVGFRLAQDFVGHHGYLADTEHEVANQVEYRVSLAPFEVDMWTGTATPMNVE